MEPRWDGVNVTLTNKQLTQIMKGLVVQVDLTTDDHNQPLVAPTRVFIRRKKGTTTANAEKSPLV